MMLRVGGCGVAVSALLNALEAVPRRLEAVVSDAGGDLGGL